MPAVEHVEPLLERYGVQLYLAGHDHDLELQRGPGSGVTHVLTGAGSQTRGFRGTTDSLFQHAASGVDQTSLCPHACHAQALIETTPNVVRSCINSSMPALAVRLHHCSLL